MSTPADLGALWQQVAWLLILPIPIASVSWTITHEEIFREVRDYCADRSKNCRRLLERKFFYILTCEYCFSHWVTLAFVVATDFQLLLDDWRGYVIGYFALTAVANLYMSLYGRLRVDIKAENVQIAAVQEQIANSHDEPARPAMTLTTRDLIRRRLANQHLAAATQRSRRPRSSPGLARCRHRSTRPHGGRWACAPRDSTTRRSRRRSTTARSCARMRCARRGTSSRPPTSAGFRRSPDRVCRRSTRTTRARTSWTARPWPAAWRVIERELGGHRHRTRQELAVALGKARIPAAGQRLAYLMMSAELDQVICSGPRRGRQFTYALLAERAPRARVLPRDEALGELTRRYFTSHGPATLRDYVWWSGLTMKDARRGVEIAGRALVQETFGDLDVLVGRFGADRPRADGAPPAAHLRRVPHRLQGPEGRGGPSTPPIPPSRPWTDTPTGSSSTACSRGRGGAAETSAGVEVTGGTPQVADRGREAGRAARGREIQHLPRATRR